MLARVNTGLALSCIIIPKSIITCTSRSGSICSITAGSTISGRSHTVSTFIITNSTCRIGIIIMRLAGAISYRNSVSGGLACKTNWCRSTVFARINAWFTFYKSAGIIKSIRT
jgi:hypothetical protein